jgi:hypothetical protein
MSLHDQSVEWSDSHVWTTTDGRTIRYSLLTDEHLVNILNWIEASPHHMAGFNYAAGKVANYVDAYFHLRRLAMERGLRWRSYTGKPLRDGDLWKRANVGTNHAGFHDKSRAGSFGDPAGQDNWEQLNREPEPTPTPAPAPDPRPEFASTCPLSELEVGRTFRREGFHRSAMAPRWLGVFMKVDPIGLVDRAITEQGGMTRISGATYRRDCIGRCAVVNMATGRLYMMGSYERVIPIWRGTKRWR